MMDRTIGRTISHYTILGRLGAGGMGVVYKALDSKLERLVAVKFLPPHLGDDEYARARFIEEAKAASALDHPNIGTIFEIDESPDVGLFIAMAYYAGESLADRILRGPLPLAMALDFAVQAGEGLAKAHDYKIIHRDIKPGNMMVTEEGILKILDFGLAKVQSRRAVDDGVILGTLRFMSPERFSEGIEDHRCDIWALGVVLYNMVTGRLPFDCEDTLELMARIRDAEPAPFKAPPELRSVVLKALEKQPSRRHRTTNELVAELRELQLRLVGFQDGELADHTRLSVPIAHGTTSRSRRPSPAASGERRQLTVLSCELSEWPALAARLDSEQLRQVLVDYHAVCEAASRAYDGQVAQSLDGELTIHFGYPRAHEDDALRAVSAGLQIVSGFKAVTAGYRRSMRSLSRHPPAVRVGVHTGEVIAGDSAGFSRHAAVSGVAGTVAGEARASSEPGELVITEDTHRLVRGFFEVEEAGEQPVTGSPKPVLLYRVISRTAAADRFAAAAQFGLTEFVGRGAELALLDRQWAAARDGAGQVMLLSGEAGVGKSRLIERFKERLPPASHQLLECRCSPYHQHSPLFPLVDMLSRLFSLELSASPADRRESLRTALGRYGLSSSKELQTFAAFFSVPSAHDSRPIVTSQRQREDTLRALLKLFHAFASDHPLLFVVEDLHWADPTTLDFLTRMVAQRPSSRSMAILTFRPEFVSPWDRRADLNQFTLGHLSQEQSKRLIRHLTSGRELPPEVLKQVIDNSDGIPLFVEELTKAVLESGVLTPTADGYALAKSMTLPAVPMTLRDSLMARLDRLGGAKDVAQLASVLGRTFSYKWLEAISSVGEAELRRHLARLVEAGLLYLESDSPTVSYTFKHALIKDAAYMSLLTRPRQQCHERIARALERRFPAVKDTQPELLAHHYAEARRIEKAVSYWRLAGQRALVRSANVEAAAHFGNALNLLRSLPETAKRRQQQLELVIALGGAQVATMGYAAVPVGEAFSRARELCAKVGDTPQLFDALQGLYAFHLVRAELETSRELSARLIELSARLNDGPRALEATLRHGISLYTLGNLPSSRERLEHMLAQSDHEEPRETALRFGQDRIVAASSHLSIVLWLTGDSDQAVAATHDALRRAQQLVHPFSVAFALLYAGIIRSFRNEPTQVQAHAASLAALCQEQGFAYRLAQSRILDGWARATRDRDVTAIPAIQQGIERARATGAEVLLPYYMALLADASLVVGQLPSGLTTVREALDVVQRTGECFFQSELERLYGELLLACGADRSETAIWFTRALDTARSQRATSFELRAALSIFRLRPDGRAEREQLEDVLRRLPGADTSDTRAARSLLQQAT